MRRGLFCFLATAGSLALVQSQTVGPASGSLVLAGGGRLSAEIFQRFVDLAGGEDARLVMIPTAGAEADYDESWSGLKRFAPYKHASLTLLHTRDRATSDAADFTAPLTEATGVWFSGGRQWRLADAYLDTRVHAELRALLKRGGVIGGSSAGATIQGSYLVRGDTKTNQIMMGDHEEGLGFLRNVGVDQHLLRLNRQFDLIPVIRRHPGLLGIGIDEGAAIVVSGDEFEVIGDSYAAVYDIKAIEEGARPFVLLAPSQRYDMAARRMLRRRP